jgi:hypothetical protein
MRFPQIGLRREGVRGSACGGEDDGVVGSDSGSTTKSSHPTTSFRQCPFRQRPSHQPDWSAARRRARVGLRRERRRCRRNRNSDSTTAGRLTRQRPSRLCPSRQRPFRQSDWPAARRRARVGLRRERRRCRRDRTSDSTTIGRLARQRLSRQCPSRHCRSGADSWVTSASRALLCRRAAPGASRQRGLQADAGRLCRSSATSRRLMRRVASRSRPRRG